MLALSVVLFEGCGGGNSTLTPQPSIVLPAASAKTCIYPSTRAQTVALPSAGGVSGTISVGAFPAASQTCLTVTLATGTDTNAGATAASLARIASIERRALSATPAPAPTPMPLLTISIDDAFSYGFVVTGMTLTTPSNLNFPDGTYYATISDQPNVGYVFTAKGGTLTLSSTNAQFLVIPFDTATLTLYPRGYVPVFSDSPTASPSASAVASPSAVPSASTVPSSTPVPTPTPTPRPTPKPTATPVPTATPTPSPTPTATPPSSALLNTGPFTPSFTGFGPLNFTVETINGATQAGGNFVVNKSWTENGVAYVETFSIPVNALIFNPATGVGPFPPTYTYISATGIGYIQLSDDANYEFSNLTITPTPPFGDGGFDNDGAIYLYFPNDAVASQFGTNFAAYVTYLENTLPYIRNDKTRRR
jgi:hypothetical protein